MIDLMPVNFTEVRQWAEKQIRAHPDDNPSAARTIRALLDRLEAAERERGRLRAEVASQVRNIASRIGPARQVESVKEDLESLANQYEFWARDAEEREWRPIETAPKDYRLGLVVLYW